MDRDQRALIRQLFAQATMIASICQEWAIAGQSPKLTINQYDAANLELGRAAERLRQIHLGIDSVIRLTGNEIKGPKI
jgi:hypothetical protein